MATTVRAAELRKRYPGENDYALGSEHGGVSFEVEAGEVFALLGPTGCGKTTTLRIIGGFLRPTTGGVEINGVDVTREPPYRRPTNTVFQNYALFPNMTVEGNVAFALSMEAGTRTEKRRRVAQVLDLVGLHGMEKRHTSELSGGQAQRVALARAVVKRPAVLLLDEPLGALDRRTRQQMQGELVRLKEVVGITSIHVTHDQEEACTLADRIAVMDRGVVVQVDEPLALFRSPRTSYVARFIDAGTIIRGPSTRRGDVIEVVCRELRVRGPAPGWLNGTGAIAAVLAPERVRLALPSDAASASTSGDVYRGTVQRAVFTGTVFEVYVDVGELEVRSAVTVDDMAAFGDAIAPGADVELAWSPEDVIFVQDAPR